MPSRKSITETIPSCLGKGYPQATLPILALLTGIMFGLPGCQRFPGSQAMRQYQLESDRLLAEYRAEKKRNEDLTARNGLLEQRLAESEKLLARNTGGSNSRGIANNASRNRNDSELTIGNVRDDRNPINGLSDANSSRNSARGPAKIQRGGLADALPSTSGKFTSSNRTDPISLGGGPRDLRGDPKSESQWLPINRAK
jgi:hypothetical protein